MKYKPLPRYVDGAVVPYGGPGEDTSVGRMFLQPDVENAAGERVRLDDTLGTSFAVLGLHVDPASVLDEQTVAWWRALGARFVQVVAPRGAPGPDPGGRRKRPSGQGSGEDVVVEDVDGAFRDRLLRRPGDQVIVLRPDRYVAAVCSLAELPETTARLRAILGEPGSGR
jgi:3-(3-hydroxy-phenyl)propionate hydroxylase